MNNKTQVVARRLVATRPSVPTTARNPGISVSQGELVLKVDDSVPIFRVTPDPTSKLPVESVDIYYSYGRQPQVCYWAAARRSVTTSRCSHTQM